MERAAAPPLATSPPARSRPYGIGVLALIALAELALLAFGFAIDRPLYAALLAVSAAFFLLAFRSPDIAWALVWVTVPPNVEVLLGGGLAMTIPTEPMILLALLAWFMRSIVDGRWTLPPSPLHLPLAVLVGLALVSALWSVSPVATLKSWVMLSGYVAFGYLYFFQGRCDRRRHERWMLLIAITGAAWGAFGVVRVLLQGTQVGEAVTIASTYSFGAFRPFFREHGTYGAYLSMLLPAALLASMERTGRLRILYGVSALFIGSGVLLAFARAGWLSILIVVPVSFILWVRWRRAARRLIFPAFLILAVVSVVGIFGISRQVTSHAGSAVSAENVSNLERLNRWGAALSMARDRPMTGVGFGCYLDAYPSYKRWASTTEQSYKRMGTHSEPLKLLSELGVPGLLVALWFLGTVWSVALRSFRRLPDAEERVLALAALAGLATYCVNGLFNSYLVEDKVTVPFWAAIGVIGALGRRLEEVDSTAAHGRDARRDPANPVAGR